ncbi:fasciclin domain-containing protein [Spirosoma rhododendri]|uniref:Fasciclin domain-containing protein n=1 Tax=Spirosoma rhododendri TaxID=2728024 RepID=A0A7L5DHJ9_9BACT|nr:fasciclin domain-containing protein [Spirosoma rhododendri]QJD77796.1 fasciclin domain-containing protein [Spirosoma rhododendri]
MNRFMTQWLLRVALFFILGTSLTGCGNEDEQVAVPRTIADRVQEDDQFQLLRAATNYAAFGGAFKSANMTLLAPNNDAFVAAGLGSEAAIRALPQAQVRALLTHHMLYAPLSTSAIPSGQTTVQTADNGVVFINKTASTLYINGAKLVQSDIQTANGPIQVIDKLLSPSQSSLLATIDANQDLTFLSAAVKRLAVANPTLLTALSSTSSGNLVTLFAPTNDAFRAAGYSSINAIESTSSQTLSSLLSYHAVSGSLLSYQFQTGVLTTLNGARLTVFTNTGTATIKGNRNSTSANIKQADLISNNGVIHIVDQVLLP